MFSTKYEPVLSNKGSTEDAPRKGFRLLSLGFFLALLLAGAANFCSFSTNESLVSVGRRTRAINTVAFEAAMYENMIVEKAREFIATHQNDEIGPISDAEIVAALHTLETEEPESAGASASLLRAQTFHSCEADVAIDVIAIVLGLFKIPGGAAKRAARTVWNKLPTRVKRNIITMLKKANTAQDFFDIAYLVYENTSSAILYDALYYDLSYWDIGVIIANMAASFASGSALLVIDIGYKLKRLVDLATKIANCASAF